MWLTTQKPAFRDNHYCVYSLQKTNSSNTLHPDKGNPTKTRHRMVVVNNPKKKQKKQKSHRKPTEQERGRKLRYITFAIASHSIQNAELFQPGMKRSDRQKLLASKSMTEFEEMITNRHLQSPLSTLGMRFLPRLAPPPLGLLAEGQLPDAIELPPPLPVL
jgi:hypothetical protein